MKKKILGLGMVISGGMLVGAIERPVGEQKSEVDRPVEQPQGGILEKANPAPKGQRAVEVIPVEEKVAYLGVGGDPADEVLLSHLQVKSGLVVSTIDPQSAAAKVLQQYDVIHSLDEKLVGDQESLREILSDYQPEQEVRLGIIRAGKAEEVKVVLGSVPERLQMGANRFGPAGFEELLPDRMGRGFGGIGDPEIEKRLMEQLEKAFGGDGGGFKQLKLDLNGDFLNGDDVQMGLKSAGSMRLEDAEGSIEMKMKDGKREVRVMDKQGKLLYEGPYDNDIDKAAVPEEFRERVESLGFGNMGGGLLQFKFNNQGRIAPKKNE